MRTRKKYSLSPKTKIIRRNSNRKKENLSIQYKNLQSKLGLKDLRIILRDIAADNLIPPHQQYLITKRINSAKVINKRKISTNKKTNLKKGKSSVNGNKKLIRSKVKYTSKTIKKKSCLRTIRKHGSKKKKETKKELDKQLNVDTNLSYTKERETCFVKPLPSIDNDNVEKRKLNINNTVEYTEKHKNTNSSIVTKSYKINLFSDTSDEKVSIPDTSITSELKNHDLNSKENPDIDFINNQNLKDEYLHEKAYRKFSEEMQIVPLISEDIKKVDVQSSKKEKILPEVINNILIKNIIILVKEHDNNSTHTSNDSQHMNYSTDTISKVKINECSLVEEPNRVIDLTVDNVHEFIESRKQSYLFQLQINNSSNIAATNVCNSINDKTTDTMLQIKEDSESVSHKKRNWLGQNEEVQFNKASNKKFKLDRTYIQEKSCDMKNNFLFNSNNSCNTFSKCDDLNKNDNNVLQNTDDHITSNSNNNSNTPYKAQLMQESIKTDFDAKKDVSNSLYTIFDLENEKNESIPTKEHSTNTGNIDEDNLNEARVLACRTQLDDQEQVKNKTQDDTSDDDCISLYAETFITRDEIFILNNESKTITDCKNYKMIESDQNTLDTNIQHNILESPKIFDTFAESDISLNKEFSNSQDTMKYDNIQTSDISSTDILSANAKTTTSINSVSVNNNKDSFFNNNCNAYNANSVSNDKTVIQHIKKIQLWKYKKYIKGYCYCFIKNGLCLKKKCFYKHDLQKLIDKVICECNQHLTNVIDHLWSLGYIYFVEILYIRTVEQFDITSIMNIYKKFYLQKRIHLQVISATIKAFLKKGMNPSHVVNNLCKSITHNDNLTPYYIMISMKQRIKSSDYWNTLRTLFRFVKPDKEIIEPILNDCIINHRNIQDVYINLIKKLHPNEIKRLDKNLMSSFNNLLQHQYQNCYDEISPKSIDNNENFCNKPYTLHSISKSKPHSLYRDKFWHLHRMLNNLKEKLLHEDYDYVINMLNMYQETDNDQSLYSRSCFRIFCTEIKHSEYYISKIIKHAVQTGAINVVSKILDIAIYILTKLVIDEIWIQAYKLLEILQICNVYHDAAFVILSAEIYLANNQVIKAFMLLKQSNIISTNRKNWNVISNAEDYYLRTNIISILLDALCEESSEYAFFMFQFLVKDQVNSFEPIDLACYVDKLMLKFLTKKETELIVKMGYMIIEYNFTFINNVTCRAAIATLVYSDIMLAKQLYQYASGLGIYRTIEISSVIRILINSDWVEEEIYLLFLDFFRRLAMNVGHTIDRFNPMELSIYIIFEDIPTEANLYYEKSYDQEKKQINISKQLVRQVLHTQFDPSLTMTGKVNDTIVKLNSTSVIDYLKYT
ncbi:MATH and LRR domain-containing protein PFE0570w-like isoform X2 [Vespula pensylvanica]|uniref:MATH and LRR domain-containing protein PFE0570w-like isoform X2 n=1 Tax=Vespula pensylvanica TaxID=30213 RepID=UPI001CB9F1EA|nr:MATH and LRR domain-containing protein PFE0570w-like isoform X2 [Vespula pensylvanica]